MMPAEEWEVRVTEEAVRGPARKVAKKPAKKPSKKPAKKAARKAAKKPAKKHVREEELVIVFVPALVALLARAERLKGAPLTRAEVERMRDEANCAAVPADVYVAVEERRGYPDLDPEQAWEGWQAVRGSVLSAAD
jgi:hypothetical protein